MIHVITLTFYFSHFVEIVSMAEAIFLRADLFFSLPDSPGNLSCICMSDFHPIPINWHSNTTLLKSHYHALMFQIPELGILNA